jgi:hypothetical protein
MQQLTSAAKVTRLADFRQFIYDRCFVRARDALFEMLDAVIITRSITSFAELSLSPVFRRQWPSLYEALDDAVIDRQAVLGQLLAQVRRERPEAKDRLLMVIDHSSWPRAQAYCLEDRSFCHKADPVPGNTPITIGYDYSTIGWVADTTPDSWCLPLLHERIRHQSAPLVMGAEQVHRLLDALGPDAERVMLMGDIEYGSARFVALTADAECDKLFRLRPNRVLYQAPPEYCGHGRRRKHGAKFRLKDETSWGEPSEQLLLNDPKLGTIRVRRFSQLHFVQTPQQPMEVLLVEQLRSDGSLKRAMWLMYLGTTRPSLDELWRLYLRRFSIDHWYRFAKQRLHWTRPKLSTAERSEHWSDLMPLAQWQLYLARDVVSDTPLPWQKPQSQQKLTPGRVAEGFAGVLLRIGTPASAPKPRGKSPGWPIGRPRQRRQQHPIERKTTRRWKSTPKSPP